MPLWWGGGVEEQMHNVDYDPEPQLVTNIKIASAGNRTRVACVTGRHSTYSKELSRQLIPVLRIRDVYPRSRILIFSHPGSWIQNSNKRQG